PSPRRRRASGARRSLSSGPNTCLRHARLIPSPKPPSPQTPHPDIAKPDRIPMVLQPDMPPHCRTVARPRCELAPGDACLPLVAALLVLEQLYSIQPVLDVRSEEHTSELQSREKLVCSLLLEKNKNI